MVPWSIGEVTWDPHGGEKSIWHITLAFSGSPWWGEINMAHHPCLLGVPMLGRDQYGYITLAFLGFPWWGEINLLRSGCGGNEQKKWMKMGETR